MKKVTQKCDYCLQEVTDEIGIGFSDLKRPCCKSCDNQRLKITRKSNAYQKEWQRKYRLTGKMWKQIVNDESGNKTSLYVGNERRLQKLSRESTKIIRN